MTHTGYLGLIEQELRALLAEGNTEDIVTWVKDHILESYRNGKGTTGAGAKDTKRPPQPRAAH
jgi:hypothetical protein